LYTIPVNEAFDKETECPYCAMLEKLNNDALDFTLGPSYMEDDVRMETNRLGFCGKHVKEMYVRGNRLGLALMLKTHSDDVIEKIEKMQKGYKPGKTGLFSKKEEAPLNSYIDKVSSTCFICNKVDDMFKRFVSTSLILYGRDENFRRKVASCKGYCLEHYNLLLKEAPKVLSGRYLEDFASDMNKTFISGLKRVNEDLSWFIDKFDYRYVNEPWKNSKDSLQRMALKLESVSVEPGEEGKKAD
ncbi:MAG: DUF6062 family protein, partial [Lachnospiraceae bacterium]|nr:DUF6062 family protein [Lachnospiraceae bacterium]